MSSTLKLILILFSASLWTEFLELHGCKKEEDDPLVTTSAPPEEEEPTELTLSLTDAPADSARRVVVEIQEVKLDRAPPLIDAEIEFDPPLQIDLLALQGLNSQALTEAFEIPSGEYRSIALEVRAQACEPLPEIEGDPSGSFIELADGSFERLSIPQGGRQGLRIRQEITMEPGGTADFTIDFDLRKSVRKVVGEPCHQLVPSLRLVDNATAGVIRGLVDASLLTGEACSDDDPSTGSFVYVYEGSGVVPDDIDDLGVEPLTSERVAFSAEAGGYEYIAGFLPPGDYTVALTCEGTLDEPNSDDAVFFQLPANVTVAESSTTTHNFMDEPLPVPE